MTASFCRNCGIKLKDYFVYCTKCGIKVEEEESGVTCSLCELAFPEDGIVSCYDCGKPFCFDCAGSGWKGACPDCEEVFVTE